MKKQKVTLISFYFVNPGVRFLSAYLKRNGFDVSLIFLPPDKMYLKEGLYPKEMLERVYEISKDSLFIGLSVFTNDYYRALQLTGYLKGQDKGKPVIWGGIHPTISPENSLDAADYVYRGEGELGVLELAKVLAAGKEAEPLENIGYKRDGKIILNPVRPYIEPLDIIPPQDFDADDHWYRSGDSILPVSEKITKEEFGTDFQTKGCTYLTVFSRGCPLGCAYCCNNKLNEIYKSEKKAFRIKGAGAMIEDLEYAIKKMPFIRFIYINDDNFLFAKEEDIERFASLYKEKIALPFKVLGAPNAINEKGYSAFSLLKSAGLKEVHMGIQSGSARVNRDIYKRYVSNKSVVEAAKLIKSMGFRARYDFIYDNPYETESDLLGTAKLMLELPRPFIMQSFSLTFYPGTELYLKARSDGIINKDTEDKLVYEHQSNIFSKERVTYLKFVCLMISRVPKWAGSMLIHPAVIFIFSRDKLNRVYAQVFSILKRIKDILRLKPV